jgi:hypothetical protein
MSLLQGKRPHSTSIQKKWQNCCLLSPDIRRSVVKGVKIIAKLINMGISRINFLPNFIFNIPFIYEYCCEKQVLKHKATTTTTTTTGTTLLILPLVLPLLVVSLRSIMLSHKKQVLYEIVVKLFAYTSSKMLTILM